MPANFPPSGHRDARAERHGHAGPPRHLRHVFASSRRSRSRSAARRCRAAPSTRSTSSDGVVHAALEGPDNPFLAQPEKTRRQFTAYIDAGTPLREARRRRRGAAARAWASGATGCRSSFELMPSQQLHAEVPLLSEAARSRISSCTSARSNLDPLDAGDADLARPAGYAAELARATGRFYSAGHARGHEEPQDRRAVTATSSWPRRGSPATRSRGSTVTSLDGFDDGLLFYYFGNVDQVSHMMWRATGSAASRLRRRDRPSVRARRGRSVHRPRWRGRRDTSRRSARTICWS